METLERTSSSSSRTTGGEEDRGGAGLAIPLLLHAEPGGAETAASFVRRRRESLRAELARRGAVLLRGFPDRGTAALTQVAEALGASLMEYVDRAAHRTQLAGRVYTSADYPPHHEIFLHNESTYASRWPTRLFLHCVRPASEGGQTPVADVRRVLAAISPATRRAFAERGVQIVRNFGTGPFGPKWQDAFQTDDRNELEDYCRRAGIETEWLGPERLRTRQVRPALLRHPATGEPLWFNHAAALHVSTLQPRVRRSITRLFSEEDYPTQVYFGDGATIEAALLDEIRHAYRAHAVPVAWQAGDFLLLDNLLVAHGRAPFRGEREVVVAMSDPSGWDEVKSVGLHEIGAA